MNFLLWEKTYWPIPLLLGCAIGVLILLVVFWIDKRDESERKRTHQKGSAQSGEEG